MQETLQNSFRKSTFSKLFGLGFFVTALLGANHSSAADWPTKNIVLVVPAPPAGNIDIAARLVGAEIQKTLGQNVLIDNRVGASGAIAAQYVKTTGSDHVLLFSANFLLFTPLISGNVSYDWKRDFVPVGPVSFTPMVLEVHPSVPAKTVKELLDVARGANGSLMMAAPGIGTSNHLVSELLQVSTGVKWTTVHYRGNAPATAELVQGVAKFQFDQLSSSLPHIRTGALRALAVTSAQRLDLLPDVPTMEEAGFPGLVAETFTGVFAPAGTSAEVVKRLSDALVRAVSDKSVAERLLVLGSQARSMSTEQFSVYLDTLDVKWSKLIRDADIKEQ